MTQLPVLQATSGATMDVRKARCLEGKRGRYIDTNLGPVPTYLSTIGILCT